ncbi:MAG: phosphatidylglycerophosphatase A [Lysobacterales bacterium]|jgi:phosphatidylglycerophosphatase A|nr:MAG: phosphatidylglycerophosphatase A [Xanthomonadales bacterium]
MTTSPEDRPSPVRPTARHLADPVHLLALGFGAGLAPIAPGTFGSLVGLGLALAVAPLGFSGQLVAAAIVTAAGFWICGASARRLRVHDHPAIVWDEIAGMMIAMLAAPQGWRGAVLAFVLFRLFDVWKPWPIREIDHGMAGGAGIMLDDVLAGIFAALALLSIRYLT